MPIQTSPEPKVTGFRDQAVLTVKVLLIAGGTLGLLAVLEWIVAS